MKTTGDKKIDGLLLAARRALRVLPHTDGRPRARRTARNNLLAVLRGLRVLADSQWPAIRTVKRAPTPKTAAGKQRRENRMLRGWVPTDDTKSAIDMRLAGAAVKEVGGRYYVRDWADAIGPNPARLRAAARSKIERDAALAEAALK